MGLISRVSSRTYRKKMYLSRLKYKHIFSRLKAHSRSQFPRVITQIRYQNTALKTKETDDGEVHAQNLISKLIEKRKIKEVSTDLITKIDKYQNYKENYEQNEKENLLAEYSELIPITYQPEYIENKWQMYWNRCALNYPHSKKEKEPFTMTTMTKGLNTRYNVNDCY